MLPSWNAGDAGHDQPLPSSVWITNGFYWVFLLCLVFLLCVLLQVRWDLWRSVVQPSVQHDQHLSQIRHSGSCPGELQVSAGIDFTCSAGILFLSLTSFPGGGGKRKVSWNFPCSYPWPLLLVFSLCTSEKDLPVFHPALPIPVLVAAAPQVLPQPEHTQLSLWLLMPAALQHSTITAPPHWAPSLLFMHRQHAAATQQDSWSPGSCAILSSTCWIPFGMTHIFLSHGLHCCVAKISAYILLRMTLDSREVLQSDTGVIWDEWPPPSSWWHSVCKQYAFDPTIVVYSGLMTFPE